jgi:predicted Zn finger-like uncharacterized protein
MVVECPECGTRFSLDESRISGATAKVRCSQCGQVFRINRAGQVVERPAEPPAEAAPPPEAGEEAQVPPAAEVGEVPPPPEEVEARLEATREGPEAAMESPKSRLRVWIVILMLAAPFLAALGWWIWYMQQPEPAALGPKAGREAPAPYVVTPSPPPVPATGLQDLVVNWAQANYKGLVNAQGEQVLVIRGEVVNEGRTTRGPIRLKATLTNAQDQPLREEVVYAGTSLTNEEVKTLAPTKIKSWLDQPGGRSQKLKLKPGEKQPFTAVFFGVPANLTEIRAGFQLVVVEGPVVGDKSGGK